jgi:hypothetical protein
LKDKVSLNDESRGFGKESGLGKRWMHDAGLFVMGMTKIKRIDGL